jgi:hypothetical protein
MTADHARLDPRPVWLAHEVFWGELGMGVGGDVVEEKKQASGAHERTAYIPRAYRVRLEIP